MKNPWYEVFVDLGELGTMTLENHDTYEDAWNWREHHKHSVKSQYRHYPLHINKCHLVDGITQFEDAE